MDIAKLKARDVMTKNVVTIHHEASLTEVLETLAEEKISGAPVVDEAAKPVGVISASDILSYESTRAPKHAVKAAFYTLEETGGTIPLDELEEEGKLEEILDSVPASRVMTPRVVSVRPDAPLSLVARLMSKERIHRVVVLEKGRIVGMVSSLDVLKALGRAAPKN